MNERVPKKVVIDPGHGGADPGTSANGIVEKDYNLKISKYMSNRLNELGIPNSLTRQILYPPDWDKQNLALPAKVLKLYREHNNSVLVLLLCF